VPFQRQVVDPDVNVSFSDGLSVKLIGIDFVLFSLEWESFPGAILYQEEKGDRGKNRA
jgi:hypothetical protein